MKLIDQNNIEFEAEKLCVFDTDDGEKYILFTQNQYNEKKELIIESAKYTDEGEYYKISPIPKDELYLVEETIEYLRKKINR